MIVGFRHKGLKIFYEKGDASKPTTTTCENIRLILTRPDAATTPEELNVPGYNLRQLKGI
jgi:toxin HigB-1